MTTLTRHETESGHITCRVPLTWRLYLLWVRIKDRPAPIWIAYLLMLVFVFAVAWSNVLVGGLRP